jgi:hypothetical protein
MRKIAKSKSKFGWVRGAAMVFFTFVYLGRLIPNMVDLKELALYVGVLLIPLSCILFGANRAVFLEFVGWVLLVGLSILEMLVS